MLKNKLIADKICSGQGIKLMNYDSRIVEYVIDHLLKDTPILTVHDSFIVPIGLENELYRLMQEAFESYVYF